MSRTRLTIVQGATVTKTWTRCSGDDVVKTIASITRGYPTTITVTTHGLPTGPLPVALVNAVAGLSTLDESDVASTAPADRIIATKVTADTFTVPIDSSAFTAYVSGGKLVYTAPKDLTGWSARAQYRKSVNSPVLLELNTDDGGLTLGGTEGTVALEMTAAQTAAFTAATSVCQVELVDGALDDDDADVERLVDLFCVLSPEVTRG